MIDRVAVIGSFRKHYDKVVESILLFHSLGLKVTSPAGSDVIEPGVEFVRFTSDPLDEDDPTIQSITLERIFEADFVYVVAPEGYVGRTTCYEIGRLLQAQFPIYFSHNVEDLPLYVGNEFIADPTTLVDRFTKNKEIPRWLFEVDSHKSYKIERGLKNGFKER